MSHDRRAIVVGAGPVGCVLSVLLAKQGFQVTTYEKRPDMRRADIVAGRSINLVLTRRGLRALELIGLREAVLQLTVPVLGRMMHDLEGNLAYQPYGKDDSERNYSVSRGKLNEYLLDAAERAGCTVVFEHELIDADFPSGQLKFRRNHHDTVVEVRTEVVFACDGAPSKARRLLVANHGVKDDVEMLDHGYKEVEFPPEDGEFSMAEHALHIWPRGHHMLMGLANMNRSFTGTIYLPHEGPDSFAGLQSQADVGAFFERYYADAIPLLEEGWEREFVEGPTGELGTVRCAPWYYDDKVLLVGDAAHGIVPFFGQGLNCGLEDCAVLWNLLDDATDDELGLVFQRFFERRKPNADAIADMALENFVEMRDKVGDERFLAKKKIEHRIENAMPELYRSRYALVMYSRNGYRTAQQIGEIQSEILEELVDRFPDPASVDLDDARRLVEEKLVPFYESHDVELSF